MSPLDSASVVLPRRFVSWIAARMANGKARLLRGPGRRKECLRRRHQEGLSQARDEVPPGPQSGRARKPKRSSRRPRKPTRCSPTRRSARPTTSSAMPASTRTWAAAAAAAAASAVSPMPSATSSATSSAAARGGRGAAASRSTAAPTCATAWRSRWRRRRAATDTQIRIPAGTTCETCNGSGAKPGTSAETCTHLQRPRPGAHAPGLLQHPADLPALPRQRQDHPRALHHLPAAPGRIKKQQDAASEDPGRHRRRHAHPLAGNGEPGTNGGPPGDLYVEIHIKQHEVFQRDGDDLHCEMPISFTHGGARRRDRGADARRQGRDRRCPKARRPARRSACAARASRACARATRATCTATSSSRRRSSSPSSQKELLREFERSTVEGGAKHSPQSKGWMDKVKDFFE